MLQVAELETQLGHPAAGQTGTEELSESLEQLEALLRAKDQARHKTFPAPSAVQINLLLLFLLLLRGSPRVESQPNSMHMTCTAVR